MAKNHTTFESLAAEINKRLINRLEGPTGNIVKKELQKNAQTMAAGEYSRSSGGIADPDNIISEVSNNGKEISLLVKDIAKPQDSYFGTLIQDSPFGTLESQWINNEEWMDYSTFISTGVKQKRKARPFVDKTQEAVNTTLKQKIIDSLKKGFT